MEASRASASTTRERHCTELEARESRSSQLISSPLQCRLHHPRQGPLGASQRQRRLSLALPLWQGFLGPSYVHSFFPPLAPTFALSTSWFTPLFHSRSLSAEPPPSEPFFASACFRLKADRLQYFYRQASTSLHPRRLHLLQGCVSSRISGTASHSLSLSALQIADFTTSSAESCWT